MKHTIRQKRHCLPSLFALIGVALGILFSLMLPPELFGKAIPITTLSPGKIFKTICQSFGKEGLPLAFSTLMAMWVKHPLPILLENTRRAFYFSLSTAYLATNAPLGIFGVYLLFHLAALLCHVAAGIATIEFRNETGFFPLLYFIGVLFLITVIRLLAFTLLL